MAGPTFVCITDFEFPCSLAPPPIVYRLDLYPGPRMLAVISCACIGTVMISPYGMFLESTRTMLFWIAACLSCYMLWEPTMLCREVTLWLYEALAWVRCAVFCICSAGYLYCCRCLPAPLWLFLP